MPALSKMPRPGRSIGNLHPYNKPIDCLALCDKFVHDFGCPTMKRVYSLAEIEQNFNILNTKSGSAADPGLYRRPRGTPFSTATPDIAKPELKLDVGLLHQAINRACTNTSGGLHPDTMNEQAAAAVILMGMGRRGAPYKPTPADICYHQLSCGGKLKPGTPKYIMTGMELLHSAIADQDKVKLIPSSGNTVDRHERYMDIEWLANGRMEQQHSGWLRKESSMRGRN